MTYNKYQEQRCSRDCNLLLLQTLCAPDLRTTPQPGLWCSVDQKGGGTDQLSDQMSDLDLTISCANTKSVSPALWRARCRSSSENWLQRVHINFYKKKTWIWLLRKSDIIPPGCQGRDWTAGCQRTGLAPEDDWCLIATCYLQQYQQEKNNQVPLTTEP